MKKTIFLFLIFLSSISAYANVIIGPSFRIYPSSVTQTETEITVSPINPDILFASAITINTSNGFKSEGIYASTNGGITWFGSDSCKGAPVSNHGGDPNIVIDKDNRFLITHLGSFFTGQYGHYSTDYGQTWSSAYSIITGDQDKGAIYSDINSLSPFYGRTYFSWVKFTSPFAMQFSYTTNGGISWTTPVQVNNPSTKNSGADVKVANDGTLYISWAAVVSTTPQVEDYVGFARSTNGGQSFTVNENVYDVNGITGTLPSKNNIRVNGLPQLEVDRSSGPRSGWIYIFTTEKNLAPAGSDPDIVMHRSTDKGQTWSQGIRVNQDPLNNGKIQYFPAVRIDGNGGINLIYYDDRRTSLDSAEVYLARSTDGGNNWIELPVSDHKFKPKPIAGGGAGYQGDNISITSAGNKLLPLWSDDGSGIYQAWTTIIDINSLGITRTEGIIPSGFRLSQNYPNPFNPSTNIEFSISISSFVTLNVYDITGKVVGNLVNENLQPGNYKVSFNTNGLPGGVYFYNMTADSGSDIYRETKKMILIK